jgi:amylosucrase
MMVSLWESLATREVEFMRLAMNNQFALGPDCAWINYVRSHDDIGWGFANEDAEAVGINGHDHRFFLNQFYTGRFPGSFATGLPFNYNPRTQDMRISGTTASLAGLEQALKLDNALYRENALKRIVLIYSICLSAGGIPLIYLGDEIGTLNDYRYQEDPAKAPDSRWVHRPFADWDAYALRNDAEAIAGQVFQRLRHLIQLRKRTAELANGETEFLATSSPHVLAYTRHQQLLIAANFSDFPQEVDIAALCAGRFDGQLMIDLVSSRQIAPDAHLRLEPYEFMWLQPL